MIWKFLRFQVIYNTIFYLRIYFDFAASFMKGLFHTSCIQHCFYFCFSASSKFYLSYRSIHHTAFALTPLRKRGLRYFRATLPRTRGIKKVVLLAIVRHYRLLLVTRVYQIFANFLQGPFKVSQERYIPIASNAR